MSRRWTRVVLVVLAVPNLFVGLWAVLAPSSWYENFPGWSPRLVAAVPPYNEHLATDAGAGLFAAGLLALLAAVLMRRDVIMVAMTGYLAFSLPHALYHLASPADALSASEDATNTLSLWVGVAVSTWLLVDAVRSDEPSTELSRGDGR